MTRPLALLLLALAPAAAAGGDRYFLTLCGSETKPIARPAHTHTWAILARVSFAPGCAPRVVGMQTISWMPATLVIRPLAVAPEPGRNLEHFETLRHVVCDGQTVGVWGPFEVCPELSAKFAEQTRELDSGRVRYKSVTPKLYGRDVDNCVHAVSDIDGREGRAVFTLSRYGHLATQYLALEMTRVQGVIDPEADHRWLLGPLGLAAPGVRWFDLVRGPLSQLTVRGRVDRDELEQ